MAVLRRVEPRTGRGSGDLTATGIVGRSVAPAIATDHQDRILALNDAALSLLELERVEAVGRTFRDLLCPRDLYGNPLGYDGTMMVRMLGEGEPFQSFECMLRTASGKYQRMKASIVVVLRADKRRHELAYVLWPQYRRRRADEAIDRLLEGPAARQSGRAIAELRKNGEQILTSRQREILSLISGGHSSGAVAEVLGVSPDTVRNHLRNIFARLGVHSRVEAVSKAYKLRLL